MLGWPAFRQRESKRGYNLLSGAIAAGNVQALQLGEQVSWNTDIYLPVLVRHSYARARPAYRRRSIFML